MSDTSSSAPTPWRNPVKVRLEQDQPAIGLTVTVNHPEPAIQAAAMGFDFLWIEMEHSPVSLDTVRSIVLGTRGLPAIPFARVPVNELWMAKRVLDAGVLGVIFPFSSTPALARQAADACHYPPNGKRGSGAGLASFRWPAPEGYYDFADRNVVTVIVIEEEKAVEQIDEIAATPGVDVLFVGPSDLSFSMGLRGDMAHPRVAEAMKRVVSAAHRNGKSTGRYVSGTDDMKLALDQGFRLLQAGTEVDFMKAGAQQWLGPHGRWRDPIKSPGTY